jgi:hypothetical protein
MQPCPKLRIGERPSRFGEPQGVRTGPMRMQIDLLCAVEAQERSKFNDLTRDRTVFTRRTYRCPTRAEISKEERDKSMCGARPTRG